MHPTGIEPVRLSSRDFLATSAFAANDVVVRGLDFALARAHCRRAPAVKSLHVPSTEGFAQRRLASAGVSLNLTGFTPRLSCSGAQFSQVPCVYQFRHGCAALCIARIVDGIKFKITAPPRTSKDPFKCANVCTQKRRCRSRNELDKNENSAAKSSKVVSCCCLLRHQLHWYPCSRLRSLRS